MKRIFLFTFILSVISFAAISQNLSLLFKGSPIINNDSLIKVSGPFNTTIDFPGISVKNSSTGTLSVKVKKVVIDTIAGTTNTICFGISCYPPGTYVSPAAQAIAAGASDSSFLGHYYANGKAGISHVRYVFFDVNNTSDSVSVIAEYNAYNDNGINDINRSDILFHDAYPNPANNNATFNYTLPKQANTANITIRNILGSEVMNITLDEMSGKKTISTTDLKEGIYFYSLVVNDKIYYTRKLVIRH